MNEPSKPTPSYFGFYDVSNRGYSRRYHTNKPGASKRNVKQPHILKLYFTEQGYTVVVLCIPGVPQKWKTVHSPVAEVITGSATT